MRSTSSGSCTMVSPFSENITTMVKSSATSVIGPMRGTKRVSYQSRPFALHEHAPREEARPRTGCRGRWRRSWRSRRCVMSTTAPCEAEPRRQQRREEVRVDREEQHLEDRVERDEAGAVLGVALREVVPHDHHRDAAREADEDEAEHVLGLVAQEDDREPEHQQRADDPVLHEREREHALVAEDLAELLVADLRERRVHHQDEADGDRDRGRADAHAVERRR